MKTVYNSIAGQSLDRLAALSDGIFAVAMTLLVIDLHTPAAEVAARFTTPLLWTNQGLNKELALLHALGALLPHFLPYVMSFLTLGIFWVGQQTQFNYFVTSNRHLTWIHLAFLLAVSLMPFSTGLLAEFITYRIALGLYWLHLLVLGCILFISWRYAYRAGLLKDEVSHEIRAAAQRRIVYYQILYAAAMLFFLINTYISIILIILMQLNSALAPRIGRLNQV
ncbi:hypothetical protein KDA_45470 [Dictyobacter alpinus]|uniref:DUF1211 domain-containing membrane protein n=1 Tax=Dictyobacter alpinus TaxID=2014873 RepID=A0A402BCF3_9CHLR|nr:TMEM175 family protein [Dictyobacter alpinus]GCE29063.1 hypothetical protein KDA_45470 [Dictyobacter alpinus]